MQIWMYFWELLEESAPWLLLGLMFAGLIRAWVPAEALSRHLGRDGLWSSLKAAVLGAPLPLCSCGVIPAALGLRRSGASRSATTSFLVSTPETGVDSVALSYALLGPVFALVRPLAAIFSAVLAGTLAGWCPQGAQPVSRGCAGGGCCGSAGVSAAAESHSRKTPWQRLREGQRFAFGEMFADLAFWLLIGLVFAAVIRAWLPPEFLAQWTHGWGALLLMAVIGVPMYICASSSTPVAAGMLLAGVSPGAVLVFLLAGPATNVATMGLVRREMGAWVLGAYLAAVLGVALAGGWLFNRAAALGWLDVQAQLDAGRDLMPDGVALVSALVVLALSARVAWGWLRRRLGGAVLCG